MVFHRTLSDNKSPRVCSTLLSILTDLNNAVVWMVSTSPLISKSSGPTINPSVTVIKAPVIIVNFMFHSFFFQFLSKVQVLIFLFAFFFILLFGQPGQQSPLYSVVSQDSKLLLLLLLLLFSFILSLIYLYIANQKNNRDIPSLAHDNCYFLAHVIYIYIYIYIYIRKSGGLPPTATS